MSFSVLSLAWKHEIVWLISVSDVLDKESVFSKDNMMVLGDLPAF